eukprot:199033_1
MSEFTMVFIDLDNTMIPSRMHKVIHYQLGFDIYRTLSSTLLKKLQYSIIKALDHIRIVIEQKYHQQACFAIVSNANSEWIRHRIEYSPHGKRPVFPILAKYLNANHIDFYSAMDEMYHWLSCRYGAESATDMFNDMHSAKNTDDTMQKWIWKYTTFSAILLQYKRQKHMKCSRIISLGDGKDEITALSTYSTTFSAICNHIYFLESPTVDQIQQQWKHIEDNFEHIMNQKDVDKEERFNMYNLRDVFLSDNSKRCTGNSHQISAVGTYFQLWINDLNEEKGLEHANQIMTKLTIITQERLCAKKQTKHLRKIIARLRKNAAFDAVWKKQKADAKASNMKWIEIATAKTTTNDDRISSRVNIQSTS